MYLLIYYYTFELLLIQAFFIYIYLKLHDILAKK